MSNFSHEQLRNLFKKYMDFISLQEGDFFLDIPELTDEEYEELNALANEIITDNLEDL